MLRWDRIHLKDDGLYDAVNRGFAACGDGDVLSWINADDRYQPATFVAVILHKFHNVRWVTGGNQRHHGIRG